MSYDTLPAIDSMESDQLTSYTFEVRTNGSEVARVFTEQIRGKNGNSELSVYLGEIVLITE